MGAAAAQSFFAAGTGEGRMQRGGRRKERCVVRLGCIALWTGAGMPSLDSKNHKLHVKVKIARWNSKKKKVGLFLCTLFLHWAGQLQDTNVQFPLQSLRSMFLQYVYKTDSTQQKKLHDKVDSWTLIWSHFTWTSAFSENKGNKSQISALKQILLFVQFKTEKTALTLKQMHQLFSPFQSQQPDDSKSHEWIITLDLMSAKQFHFYIKLVKIIL